MLCSYEDQTLFADSDAYSSNDLYYLLKTIDSSNKWKKMQTAMPHLTKNQRGYRIVIFYNCIFRKLQISLTQ